MPPSGFWMNGLNHSRNGVFLIRAAVVGNGAAIAPHSLAPQNVSPGTRTVPSMMMRALRLMMALVTVHWPSASLA